MTNDVRVSRRGAMKVLGAAAAGGAGLAVGSVLSIAEPAAAANGGPLILGSVNTSSGRTTLMDSSTSLLGIAFYAVLGGSSGGTIGQAAIFGDSSTACGVQGASSQPGQAGVLGSFAGPSLNGVGVSGVGPTGVAGEITADAFGDEGPNAGVAGTGNAFGPAFFALNGGGPTLQLNPFGSTTLPANSSTGQFIVLSDGSLWYCFTDNEWVQLNNGIVALPTPVRVIDTTSSGGSVGGIAGPLTPGATVHTSGVLTGAHGIPAQALGMVGNFAISGVGGVFLNGVGVATIFPAGATTPATANINAGAGCFAISNAATVRFGTGGDAGKVSLVWGGGGDVLAAEAFFDVIGYIL